MPGKKPINENDLNELLRALYLDERAAVVNEEEARFVMEQDYLTKINPAKEKDLLNKLTKKPGHSGGKLFSLFILIALLIGLALFYLFRATPVNSSLAEQSHTPQNVTENAAQQNPLTANGVEHKPDQNNTPYIKNADTFARQLIQVQPGNSSSSSASGVPEKISQAREEKVIPYLSDKDKLRYSRLKQQILHQLISSDKALYTHIDAGKIFYAGKKTIVDAFAIRNMGISNLEYKTFLADLLIQKRNEDYFIAQVFPENWAKYEYPLLANTYFQDEKYKDFPVVNITYEGAKLFCQWLEEEAKLYIQQNKLKNKPIQVRLPYDEEWIYAAREGYAKIAFEKGYNSIYDSDEGLVDKSFESRIELVKKRVKRIDTLYTLYTTNKYGWKENEMIAFFSKAFNYNNTANTDTIDTERMKVSGKIGRASEMVNQRNSSRVWLSGLSWKNKEDYLQLEKEFKSHLSSPFVGFRPVVINPADPEYKNPFW